MYVKGGSNYESVTNWKDDFGEWDDMAKQQPQNPLNDLLVAVRIGETWWCTHDGGTKRPGVSEKNDEHQHFNGKIMDNQWKSMT